MCIQCLVSNLFELLNIQSVSTKRCVYTVRTTDSTQLFEVGAYYFQLADSYGPT